MREVRVWTIAACVSASLGALLASALALAAALWSPPARIWHYYSYPSPPHYPPRQGPEALGTSGLHSFVNARGRDEQITVMDGCGAGYRTFNVSAHDVLPSRDGATNPDYRLNARWFATHLGWPQPMFGTTSWDIGEGKAHWPGHPPIVRGVGQDLGVDVDRGHILWPGAAFNSLLFASALLGLWSIGRAARRGDGQRVFTCWPALAALALWLSVLVAWGAFWQLPPRSDKYARNAREFAAISHDIAEANGEWDQFTGRVERAFGYRFWEYTFMKVDPTGAFAESVPDSDVRLELGWPATMFASHLPPDRHIDSNPLWRLFQMPVQWRGLCVNWLCFVGLLALATRGPSWIVRRRRIRRGLCPACAYPAGAAAVCTECGQSLPAKTRRRSPAAFV